LGVVGAGRELGLEVFIDDASARWTESWADSARAHGLSIGHMGGGGASSRVLQSFGAGWLSESAWTRNRRERSRQSASCSTDNSDTAWTSAFRGKRGAAQEDLRERGLQGSFAMKGQNARNGGVRCGAWTCTRRRGHHGDAEHEREVFWVGMAS
jgi:hypothetical protein